MCLKPNSCRNSEAGNIGVVGVAIYIEDRYLPDAGLRVALDQIARLYAETQACQQFAICKSYREIQKAREEGKIALLITMEGVEPLGTDSESIAHLLRAWCPRNRTYTCAKQCGGTWWNLCFERFIAGGSDRALVVTWCENAKRSA